MQSGVGALLQVWRHTCRDVGSSLVVPDGCLDLIGLQRPGHAPNWKVSTLMDRAERVHASAGTRYVGYRLKAGSHINVGSLLAATRGLGLDEEPRVMERLEAMVRRDPRVAEALQTLSEERSLRAALGQLGVSERSLQRLLQSETGRPPVYWKRLARLRQTACALDGSVPLAHLAHHHGFADQAHMNLEFRHWLGLTPTQVQRQHDLRNQLAEPGHGTPQGAF